MSKRLTNNKVLGFTLIELLAVIVILAIIATIATPIVLSIIEDTKESATLRSAEYYLDAVEQSIARKSLNTGTAYQPLECEIQEDGNLLCDEEIEVIVEVKGKKPNGGTITFEEGKMKDITINIENKVVTQNEKGELVLGETKEEEPNPMPNPTPEKTLATICTHDTSNGVAEKTAGAKYKCKVKEEMEEEYSDGYTFYVLKTPSSTDTTINLIMDQNINSDGTPAGMTGVTQSTNASKYNLVAWYADEKINTYGPVTAMQFLYNATKDWTNVEPVNYTYNDKTIQGTTATDIGYTSFVSIDGVSTITSLSGTEVTIGTNDYPLRARMPIYASDTSITEVAKKTDSNAYLYDNLSSSAAPYGYWTFSSKDISPSFAWNVTYDGHVSIRCVDYRSDGGVRPVINLKI